MRRISTRAKLAGSAVALTAVMVVAAIAQRNHRSYDPFTPKAAPTEAAQESARSRAVFGERPNPIAKTPATEPREEPAPAETMTTKGEVPADILGFLERWRLSLVRGDMNAHLATYAPRLDRFFRQRNVSNDGVRREKERMLRIYPDVNRYDISDVRVDSQSGDRAVVTFTKNWDMSGVRRFAGSERQRLTLRKAEAGWQIAGEEELKVFWVKR